MYISILFGAAYGIMIGLFLSCIVSHMHYAPRYPVRHRLRAWISDAVSIAVRV
jgi:hypothetical protein